MISDSRHLMARIWCHTKSIICICDTDVWYRHRYFLHLSLWRFATNELRMLLHSVSLVADL